MNLKLLSTLLLLTPNFINAANIEAQYEQNCSSCHGGTSTPPGIGGNLFDGIWKHGTNDEAITKNIREGIPTAGMPPWKQTLSPQEIRAMVVYLREQTGRKKDASQTASPIDQPITSKLATFSIHKLNTLPSEPWAITPLPNGGFLTTLKTGKLLELNTNGQIIREISNIPPSATIGQGGLLDVALSPHYPQDGWIYLTYTDFQEKNGQKIGMTALSRGKINNGKWTNSQLLWQANPAFYTNNGIHFGSRIAFDHQNHIFFSVGERGRNFDRGANDPTSPVGKIYRLMLDGSTPKNNPTIPNAPRGLFSYGHRNQQGLAIQPQTGNLYNSEHGPRGGDEINLDLPGHNYGWPEVTFGINYDGTPWNKGQTTAPNVTPPIHYWTPSIAVSSIDFYQGNTFPAWKNDLLVASLAAQKFIRLRIINNKITEQETLLSGVGRIRDWCQDPAGNIYLLTNSPNQLLKLEAKTTK